MRLNRESWRLPRYVPSSFASIPPCSNYHFQYTPITKLAHMISFHSPRKLDESTDTQSRTTDLNRQLTSTTSTHSLNDTAQIKTLTDRALSAEKRANHASNQLAMLEAKLAEIQSKAGKAEDKWEARVREYENRLRVAGEKIKTEKQGGKERALQLEGQVRWVFSFGFPSVTLHLASSGSYDSTPALCLDSHEELR